MTSEEKEFTLEQLEKINTYYLVIGASTVVLSFIPFKLNPSLASKNFFLLVLMMYGSGVVVLMLNRLKILYSEDSN